ncbi:hypothetical protein [Pontibacter sp. G13]|uniref:hypothetical protein n=1 Tax=Pontibacter sp. G13 TaxID=3074898 RepID=UPI002889DBBC|nr:hypothetical protein [Pontibacter sp. G13]WNJ16613.1 hypothetical protein RJD25_17245 [Pontibacter sp. G13]
MRNRIRHIALLIVGMCWAGAQAFAQCSQCKAAAASADDAGNLIVGAGINTGVLYLLAMPLLIPFIVGALWWLRARKQRAASEPATDF